MLKTKPVYIISLLIIISVFSFSAATNPPPSNDTLYLWDSGPITLDPAISSEMTSHIYVTQLFSGLVYLNDQLKPAPDIAESWQKSADGKTYTFYVRKGAKFQDGREITAHDFKYSWERTCNPQTNSNTASMYLNDIVGAIDVINGLAKEIKGVQVIDKYTLQVTIDAPKAYFLAKMSYPTAMVVDKNNVETGKNWWQSPNGSGPYKLKSWKRGESIELTANNLYYREVPKLKTIIFKLLAGNPIELYEMGEVDVSPVFERYIDKARDKNGPFARELSVSPELSLYYMGFNVQKPPFDDINVRMAFCSAIDKDRIVHLTLKDTAIKADTILIAGMPGFNKDLNSPQFNIDKAKAYLTKSKYGSVDKLPPIVVTTSGGGGNIGENLGAIIYEWKNNLGAKVKVRQLDPEIFMYNLEEEVDNLYLQGWIADYPDPQNFLDNLFRTGSTYNNGKYSNLKVDALLDQAAVEQNESARLTLYSQAEQMLLNDAPCLPMWSNVDYTLIKSYVKNYKVNAMGIPSLSQAYIDRTK